MPSCVSLLQAATTGPPAVFRHACRCLQPAPDPSPRGLYLQEEEANEIADLLTFKLAVDRSLPLDSLLLRVQGSFADFLQAEEASSELHDLAYTRANLHGRAFSSGLSQIAPGHGCTLALLGGCRRMAFLCF